MASLQIRGAGCLRAYWPGETPAMLSNNACVHPSYGGLQPVVVGQAIV